MATPNASLIFVLARALVYASLFIGFVLVYLPARIVTGSATLRTGSPALAVAGMIVAAVGALMTLWCIGSFVFVGRGTPFPLDAPRRLVVRGPYAYVRNPMYVSAILVLVGAALRFASIPLLLSAALFLVVMHALVVFHEEPVLGERFGSDYARYKERVRRWWPNLTRVRLEATPGE